MRCRINAGAFRGVSPVLGTTVLFALNTAALPIQSFQIRDSLGIRIVVNTEPAQAEAWSVAREPLAEIGVVAGDPAHELYRVVGAVVLSTGVVVVANGGSNDLRWYSPSGDHLRTVGATGGGPGEFRMLTTVFRFPGDSVAAFDVRARRLSVFDSTGEFVRSQQVPADAALRYPSLTHRFGDGTFLTVSGGMPIGDRGPTRVERLPFDVYRFTPDSDRVEVLARYPGLEVVIGPTSGISPDGTVPIGRNRRAFGRNTTIAGHADGWIVGDNAIPELQYWTRGGGLRTLARWRGEPRPTTRAEIEAYKITLVERYDDGARRRRMEAAWAAWPDPPSTKPYFGDEMHVDPTGNVWVREYIGPRERSNAWSLLDSSGVWLVEVVLPPHDRILAVGDDRVVVLHRTPLDVEIISVYEIERF
jgi:hypothetical protein